MTVPKLTPEEKMAALEKAQEIRRQRASVRKALKRGELTLTEVFDRIDEETISKMRVTYLLQSLPKVGKVKSMKIMQDIGIDESRRVQGLGSRQVEALLERLAIRRGGE